MLSSLVCPLFDERCLSPLATTIRSPTLDCCLCLLLLASAFTFTLLFASVVLYRTIYDIVGTFPAKINDTWHLKRISLPMNFHVSLRHTSASSKVVNHSFRQPARNHSTLRAGSSRSVLLLDIFVSFMYLVDRLAISGSLDSRP